MGNVQTKRKSRQLVSLGNKAYRREQYRDAIGFHSRAVQLLQTNSLERAELLDYLVKEYWRLGEIDQALKYSKEALMIKHKVTPKSDGVAKTLSDIGCIFYERGEFMKALHLLEGALFIRQAVSPGSLGVAVAFTNLALVLTKIGRRQDALQCHEQARNIKEEKAPNSVSLARTYISLSSNAETLIQAMEYLDKARAIAETVKPVPTSLLASLDMNQGNLLMAAGAYDKAIDFYEQAIVKEQRVAPESLMMASMLNQLAKACDEQGLQPEARAARGKAIAIRHSKAPTYLESAVLKK